MTDLRKLDAAATQGVWGRFDIIHGPFTEYANAIPADEYHLYHDTTHDMSTVLEGKEKPKRLAHFTHADDAAFAEALVNAYRAGELVEAPKEADHG